jgi:hypothetical protein
MRLLRHDDRSAVESLNRVNQGGPILLFENIPAYLQHIIRPESQEVAIECGVVQRAQGEPVPHKRFSGGLRVRHDMCGIQEFFVTQTAEGALTLICFQNPLTEGTLMKSHTHNACDVHTACGIGVFAAHTRGDWPYARV